jgi:bud emergence protein 1
MKSPPMPSSALKTQAFYAVVLHDFISERPDELDAKAGDSISVVAQSNREWFVAKSIGRLGKPGLIPVSFVEVRDPATGKPVTDLDALMDNGTLPRVEDWKKQMLSYKANSIALGVLDDLSQTPATGSPFSTANTNPPSTQMTSALSYQGQDPSPVEPQSPSILPDGLLLSARVVSYHFEIDEYWFRLHALYQPFDPSSSSTLPPAKDLVLFRAYNDFFDYQTTLLDVFPREAGRAGEHPRIIPFMPGPTDDVDDALSATRRHELDDYLHRICRLNRTTARYVLQDSLTREFFALKPGDVERDIEPQYETMAAVGWYDPLEDPEPVSMNDPPSPVDDVVRKLEQTNIKQMPLRHSDSEGSDYGDDLDRTAAYSASAGHSQRQQPYATHPSTNSKPHTTRQVPPDSARNGNGHGHHPSNSGQFRESSYSRSSASSSSRLAESPLRSSSEARSTRSGGTTGASAGPPPISASNPQTAFIKIKIFDRIQDDLIAIRVHPRVTHEQLLDKVQQRLGGQVARLSYREAGEDGEDFVPLQQDDEVLWWIGSTDKHVLYAD